MLSITCPTCSAQFEAGNEVLGQLVECGVCSEQFMIEPEAPEPLDPYLEAPPEPPPASPQHFEERELKHEQHSQIYYDEQRGVYVNHEGVPIDGYDATHESYATDADFLSQPVPVPDPLRSGSAYAEDNAQPYPHQTQPPAQPQAPTQTQPVEYHPPAQPQAPTPTQPVAYQPPAQPQAPTQTQPVEYHPPAQPQTPTQTQPLEYQPPAQPQAPVQTQPPSTPQTPANPLEGVLPEKRPKSELQSFSKTFDQHKVITASMPQQLGNEDYTLSDFEKSITPLPQWKKALDVIGWIFIVIGIIILTFGAMKAGFLIDTGHDKRFLLAGFISLISIVSFFLGCRTIKTAWWKMVIAVIVLFPLAFNLPIYVTPTKGGKPDIKTFKIGPLENPPRPLE